MAEADHLTDHPYQYFKKLGVRREEPQKTFGGIKKTGHNWRRCGSFCCCWSLLLDSAVAVCCWSLLLTRASCWCSRHIFPDDECAAQSSVLTISVCHDLRSLPSPYGKPQESFEDAAELVVQYAAFENNEAAEHGAPAVYTEPFLDKQQFMDAMRTQVVVVSKGHAASLSRLQPTHSAKSSQHIT
jgi:hypothetical protein